MTSQQRVGAPGSKSTLERRISDYAREYLQSEKRVRVTISQMVVAQLLPAALVKGGSAMKFRLGMTFTRDSKDLDAVVRANQDSFAAQLEVNLRLGWGPFVGTVKALAQRHHDESGYPTMQPYAVKLSVYGRDFQTVTLEVGWDELGATEDGSVELTNPDDILDMFEKLGLPKPEPVPVLARHHQIAQKIHACTEPGSDRARDLVDLQLLWPDDQSQVKLIAVTTQHQFEWRRTHSFPGNCNPVLGWVSRYQVAATDLDVLETVEEAAAWLNVQLAEFPSLVRAANLQFRRREHPDS